MGAEQAAEREDCGASTSRFSDGIMVAAPAIQVEGGSSGASAIDALGSLFKLTEVYLWGDVSTAARDPQSVAKSSKYPHRDDDTGAAVCSTSDFCQSAEDMELIEQMNALGLPVSFLTNKEKKAGNNKAKKKSSSMKDNLGFKEIKCESLELCKMSEGDVVSPSPLLDNPIPSGSLCSMSMPGQSVSSCYDVEADAPEPIYDVAEGESASLTGSGNGIIEEPVPVEVSGFQTASWNCQSVEVDAISRTELQINTELNSFEAVHLLQCDPSETCDDHMKEGSAGSFIEHNHLDADHEVIQTCKLLEHILHEEAAVSLSSEVGQNDETASYICIGEYGEWSVYWDTFYQRYYYYNIKTEESTWFPPPGLEHEIFIECTDNYGGNTDKSDEVLSKLSETDVSYASAAENNIIEDCLSDYISPDEPVDELLLDTEFASACNMASTTMNSASTSGDNGINGHCNEESMMNLSNDQNISCMIDTFSDAVPKETSELDKLDVEWDTNMRKRKKRIRKQMGRRTSSGADEDLKFSLLKEHSANIEKYWYQRYLLFSRFDDGLRLDEEGWFSVTPEPIAKHHALRCGSNTVIDGFTGVGGNAIQFAESAKHVIAIDIDARKIEYANHNAVIYGVDDRIDFVRGDFFVLAPKLKADTVFLSPPWGGPDYTKVKTYNIMTMLKPHDGFFLFEAAKRIASKVVMFLPKNVDLNQLAELALSSNPPWSLEVERNFLNERLKAITAYFTSPETGTDCQ